MLRDLFYLTYLVDRDLQALGELFASGLAAKFLDHFAAGAQHFVDVLDHVYRHAYGAGLIRDGAGDGLADPPCGISRKLIAAAPFEFFSSAHEADIPFLDQIQELQAVVGVFLGDGHNQAQVGLG